MNAEDHGPFKKHQLEIPGRRLTGKVDGLLSSASESRQAAPSHWPPEARAGKQPGASGYDHDFKLGVTIAVAEVDHLKPVLEAESCESTTSLFTDVNKVNVCGSSFAASYCCRAARRRRAGTARRTVLSDAAAAAPAYRDSESGWHCDTDDHHHE